MVAAAVTVGAFAKKAEYENLAIVMDGRKIYRTPIDAISISSAGNKRRSRQNRVDFFYREKTFPSTFESLSDWSGANLSKVVLARAAIIR